MLVNDNAKLVITNSELNDLVVYSFRYCLGRSTYAVNDINKIIRQYIDLLSMNTLKLMQTEINEAIQDDCIGMDFDKKEWQDTNILITNKIIKM